MSSLLRSTKFVRYFTGAARTLILNSAKTAETNFLINPKSLSAVNSVILRDYASTSKKTENLEPLLQRLDAEVRRFGRITKKDIDEVFEEIRSKHDITSSQSLLVIRCCGDLVPDELPEHRTMLVQKIWNILTERGVPMDVSHYNALLRVYIENEHPFSPAAFLEELEKKGLQPNRVTYQRLMWRYCQEGDVEGATKVLEKMRELSMPVSEPVLNALVMGHAFHGDTDGAKAVLETMAAAGLEPSNRTYALLACGYAKQGKIEEIEKIITSAKDKENIFFTDKDLIEIIEHLTLSGHSDKVEQIFPHLPKGLGYNQEICSLIFTLLSKGHESTARKVMKTMPKSENVTETIFKGAFYVKQLIKLNNSPEAIIQSLKEVQEEGLVPSALYIATEVALQQGNVELALKLFNELKQIGMEIRPHYYWPLLAKKGREGDEEGLLHLIKQMNNEGLNLSGEGLRDYVIPYLKEKDSPQNIIVKLQLANVPRVHSARNIMVELLDTNEIEKAANIAIQYRLRGQFGLVYRPLINALAKTKDVNSFAKLLHALSQRAYQAEEDNNDEDPNDEKSTSTEIGRIVKTAVKTVARYDLSENLLEAVHARGLRIDTQFAEEIEQYLGDKMTSKISELLAQLTSSDLELAPLETLPRFNSSNYSNRPRTSAELEKMLAQNISKGNQNVNRLQKELLGLYIKENNVEKMNTYLEELKSRNFDLTVATLAQLYEFYCNNDNITKANEMKSQLLAKNPEFQLNRYKLVVMANALVKVGKYEEAIKFLKENKLESELESASFMMNSKCWQMINHLAEQKEPAKVKEMVEVLFENNYVEPSNVILGPLIKVHILNDDLESALKEFENCTKQYRSTPWKGELMKLLIMKEDASRLQSIADMSTQIHGEVNILHDLVLAFVECGRLRQARRILETPGLHTRQRRLQDACQRYVEEGKSEYLEGLLEATKELSHIDRANIFYHLLVTYCKANETDKALGLWTVLQEEGVVPSDQFLIYLGNHLQKNNREVPFIIPTVQKQDKLGKDEDIIDKIVTPKEPPKQTKREVTTTIEKLIQNGKAVQAMDVVINSLQSGVVPQYTVIKYLLKVLAEDGNVEKIQLLGNHINESMRRNVTYDDKLTLAIFRRGAGAQHVDSLYNSVKNASSDEDMEIALRKFPRSNALSTVIGDDELLAKCCKIASIAASKGNTLPANLLWMEFLLAGKDKEANDLWQQCLINANMIVFRRLLQESHLKKDDGLMKKLIAILKTNKMVRPASLGNAYSRLINFYIIENKMDQARSVYEDALKSGVLETDLNKNSIQRLKSGNAPAVPT